MRVDLAVKVSISDLSLETNSLSLMVTCDGVMAVFSKPRRIIVRVINDPIVLWVIVSGLWGSNEAATYMSGISDFGALGTFWSHLHRIYTAGSTQSQKNPKESPKRKQYLQLIDCWWNNPISIRTTVLHGLHPNEPPWVLRILSQRLLQHVIPWPNCS